MMNENEIGISMDNVKNHQVSDKAKELIAWLREYASHRINCQVIDERRCIPPYIALDFGNQGLMGMQVPEYYGGLNLTTFDFLKICEQLSAIDLGLTLFACLHNILAIRPIQFFANKAIQEKWLPMLASGRVLGAFALTEPVAGSNPKGIITTGTVKSPGTWSVSGHKIWSGSASWSNVINVFVKLKDEQHKNLGITGFVIEQGTKGLRMGEEALTMGMRGMVQNEILLNDVSVSEANLLGSIGKGLDVAQDAMLYGRLTISTACIGAMKRCMQLMKRYTERRKVGATILLNNGVVLAKLKNISFYIATLEVLIYRTAYLIDMQKTIPQEIYCACKILGPEMLWDAADILVQTLGGRGYIETNIASRLLRDARIFRVFEGPTETLLQFIGVNLLYNNKSIINFIRDKFEAAEIADKLISDVQRISDASGINAINTSSSQQDQVLAHHIGEVGTWAILLASMYSSRDYHYMYYAWVEEVYQSKVDAAMKKVCTDHYLIDIDTTLNNYRNDIGDIEESLPGAATHMDSILRQDCSNLTN